MLGFFCQQDSLMHIVWFSHRPSSLFQLEKGEYLNTWRKKKYVCKGQNASHWINGHNIACQLATHFQIVAWQDFSAWLLMPLTHSGSHYNQTKLILLMHAWMIRAHWLKQKSWHQYVTVWALTTPKHQSVTQVCIHHSTHLQAFI